MSETTPRPQPELPMIRTEAIPAMLKEKPNWVTWRYVPRPEGNGKPFKKPHTPAGYAANVTEPRTWSSFDTVIEAYTSRKGIDGIGFVLTQTDIVAADLDNCLVDGQLTPDAQEISYLLGSYTELSPSMQGLRILVQADVKDFTGRRRGGLEVYGRNHYVTITGMQLDGASDKVEPRLDELRELFGRYLGDKATRPEPATPERRILPASDDAIIEKMHRVGLQWEIFNNDLRQVRDFDQSLADTMLLNGLAFHTQGDPAQMRRIMLSSPRYGHRFEKWLKPVKGKITYLDYQIEDSITYYLEHRKG